MEVLEKLQLKIRINEKRPKFGVLILDVKNTSKNCDGKILGRKLGDWVKMACGNLPIKTIEFYNKSSVLSVAREYADRDMDYTIVLLSTTPLLERDVIAQIMDYSAIKGVKLCKLPVGYVINTKYLDDENLTVDSLYSQNLEDFYVVENKKQYGYALDVLQDRINTFHMGNGVDIRKPRSVYIEPDVDIDEGVIIYPNNTLKGKCKIYNDVILKENNVIENSKIGNNSCISGSEITRSIISSNVYISAFCKIDNGLIGSFSTIGSGAKIINYKLEDNSKVKPNTVLGEEDDSNSGSGQSGQKL